MYVLCMDEAARRYAPSPALAIEIAEVAHSACGPFFSEYARIVEAEYISRISARNEPYARAKAKAHAKEGAQKAKGRAMRVVAEERMN